MAVDVTILGAGVFGLSTAYACLQAGASVRVIDPHGPAAGASGGVVGALAPHTPDNWNSKKQFQFESLIYARDFWPAVEVVSGRETGYTHAGRLQPILAEKQIPLALERAASATELWQDKAHWKVLEKAPTDWAPPSATGLFIFDDLSAHIHPQKATLALAAAIKELGAEISTAGRKEGLVLDATGLAGLNDLSKLAKREVGNGVKGQAAVLDYAAPDQPQLFADGLHIVPHRDGTTAIGSTSERTFKSTVKTDSQLDDLVAKAKRLFPVLQGAEILDRWAGVRPRAISRAPVLGPHPFKQNWFLANGGFKIGFGMAPLVGKAMADLMLQGDNAIPTAFDPSVLLQTA